VSLGIAWRWLLVFLQLCQPIIEEVLIVLVFISAVNKQEHVKNNKNNRERMAPACRVQNMSVTAEYIRAEAATSRKEIAHALPGYIQLTVTSSFAEIEPLWRSLEKRSTSSPFQHFDWLESWHRHLGADHDITPCLVAGRDSNGDAPVFLLPMGTVRRHGLTVLKWLGGRHTNYKMGLFDRHWLAANSGEPFRRLFEAVLDALPPVDLVEFIDQPTKWNGLDNPFRTIGAHSAASSAYAISLQSDFESLYASKRSRGTIAKARKRERSFNRRHELEKHLARDPNEILRVLETVFEHKGIRLREMGVHNFFVDPGQEDFFREISTAHAGKDNPFHLFYLLAGGEIAATWIGMADNGCMYGMMNTMSPERELRRHSPGEVLLRHAIAWCCENGFHTFDLATGESRYKSEWCDREMKLFETIWPRTLKGWFGVRLVQLRLYIKRSIKQSRRIWPLFNRFRAWAACWSQVLLRQHNPDRCHGEARDK
jgi:CelD/BcsL family acetyltransferase involved in cellulose biosynthesis